VSAIGELTVPSTRLATVLAPLRLRLLSALMLLLAVAALESVRGDARGPQEGSCSIAGLVVAEADAASAGRGADVVLTTPSGSQVDTTAAGDDGRFGFGGLHPGVYYVHAVKAGYLPTTFGAMRPEQLPSAVVLAPSRCRANILLKMWRGGVIAGTVRSDRGAAEVGIRIGVWRYRMVGGRRVLTASPAHWTETNTRGDYRLFGLVPGEYLVAALRRPALPRPPLAGTTEQGTRARAAARGSELIAAVYYPNAPTSETAVPISVGAAAQRLGIDFYLSPVATGVIVGAVLPDALRSVAALQLRGRLDALVSHSVPGSATSFTIGKDGTFEVEAIPPGSYELTVSTVDVRSQADRDHTTQYLATTEVQVSSSNVERVSLRLLPAMRISGRVVVADRPGQVQLEITLRKMLDARVTAVRRVQTDRSGRFVVDNLGPGLYGLDVSRVTGEDSSGLLVTSMSMGDRRTDGSVFRLGGSDIEVVVTALEQSASVSGCLYDATNGLSDYHVVLFPVEADRWPRHPGLIRIARPATDGQFHFLNLPAGTYYVSVVRDVAEDDVQDLVTLDHLLLSGPIKVSLVRGQAAKVDLKVTTGVLFLRD
jgi:hypothetical protein